MRVSVSETVGECLMMSSLRTLRRSRKMKIIFHSTSMTSTYGHREQKTEIPVRSSELKLLAGGLVLRWVTTWESPLLYVFWLFVLLIFFVFCSAVGMVRDED